jgi:putative phosphoesterase
MKFPCLMVISDTHGHTGSLEAALRWGVKHKVDALVFLGDGTGDMPEACVSTGFTIPWKMVRGNTDQDVSVPYADTLEFAGRSFFLSHGHLSGVSQDLSILASVAQGADAALYGHTHVPGWEEINGVLVLNPGSVGRPRSAAGASFATIECPPGEWFNIRFWEIRSGAFKEKTIKEMRLPAQKER